MEAGRPTALPCYVRVYQTPLPVRRQVVLASRRVVWHSSLILFAPALAVAHYSTIVHSNIMRFELGSVAAAVTLLVACCRRQAAAVQLWPSPAAIPTSVPALCRAALVQNITCLSNLVTASDVVGGMAMSSAEAGQYCTSGCHNSLTTFQTQVTAGCGSSMYTLYQDSNYTQSPSALVDSLVWAYSVNCIQGS